MFSAANLKLTGITLVKIWFAMFLYLATTWMIVAITVRTSVLAPMADVMLWTQNFWAPWVILVPFVQFYLQRSRLITARGSRRLFILLAGLLLVELLHTGIIAAVWYVRGLLAAGPASAINYKPLLNFFMLQKDFILFDAFVFIMLVAGHSSRTLQDQLR
ncbi:MAG: hypothetical protein V4628_13800, partial [Pseudomonadota bacterium]